VIPWACWDEDLDEYFQDGRTTTGDASGREADMIGTFMAEHSLGMLVIGAALSLVGSVWLLFAGYQCDTRLARRVQWFPILTLKMVLQYPDRCLKPFLLQCLGIVLVLCGILGMWK